MNELLKYINGLGWYSGEIDISIRALRRFEGYHGRASETWETIYIIESRNEIKLDSGEILIPKLKLEGNRYEGVDSLCNRFLDRITWKSE